MNDNFLTAPDRACAGANTSLFMPGEGNPAAAKAICRRCPHIDACLDYAQAVGDEYAVLGGMTGAERRKLREPRRTPLRMQVEARRATVQGMARRGFTSREIAEVLSMKVHIVEADRYRGLSPGAHLDATVYAQIDALDAAGVTPTQIAAELNIGRRTVYNRRAQRAQRRVAA